MAAKKNRIVWVRVDSLKVHESAQRRLVPSQVKRLMADLDLDAIGVLHGVEEDDGSVVIFDGQHRWHALMRHALGEWKVPVEIHEGRPHELFLKHNTRALVAQYDKYLNEIEAGYETALGVKRIIERSGLIISRQAADGHFAAIATGKAVYEMDGGATLSETVPLLLQAFGPTGVAVEGKLVHGLANVVSKFNGQIDRDALVKKLAKYPGGAAAILGDAKGLQRIRRRKLSACVAETIIETYDRGRRIKLGDDPNGAKAA